jgi:FAD/FMN-containing dehydrogenase
VLQTNKDEHADLFWAVRGGGGNFGVATSFEYVLHPVGPTITGGLVAYPFDRARDVMKFVRDFNMSLPDEFMVFTGLVHAPDGSGTKLSAIVACHCGSLADGETATRPLKQFGTPLMDAIGPMPYYQLNGMLDGAYPKGALNYWKSSFLSQLSDAAIDTLIDWFNRCPTPMGQLLLEHFHGAVTRVNVTDTAYPHRAAGYNLVVIAEWMEPKDTDRCIAWARETYTAMKPFIGSGRYVNYLGDDEAGDATAAAYGPSYRRLQEIKTKYDPGNFFHLNQNIRPLS